jgi:2-C-methyl-D-erythritol 4-phosphate cytidylyltransferase
VTAALILVAAGRSSRAGVDKLWAILAGKPVIAHSIETANEASFFQRVVVVAPQARWGAIQSLAAECDLTITLTEGGERRQDSVARGLEQCAGVSHVCIHDAARPLCSARLMQRVLDAASKFDAATAGIPVVDTIKRVDNEVVVQTLDRDSLIAVQTPQAFPLDLLRQAHERAEREGFEADDDAALVERTGVEVHVVAGERRNLKVTTAEDLVILNALLASAKAPELATGRSDHS